MRQGDRRGHQRSWLKSGDEPPRSDTAGAAADEDPQKGRRPEASATRTAEKPAADTPPRSEPARQARRQVDDSQAGDATSPPRRSRRPTRRRASGRSRRPRRSQRFLDLQLQKAVEYLTAELRHEGTRRRATKVKHRASLSGYATVVLACCRQATVLGTCDSSGYMVAMKLLTDLKPPATKRRRRS